jgi:hypothetical protein
MAHQQVETLVGGIARRGQLHPCALRLLPHREELIHLAHLQMDEGANASRLERHGISLSGDVSAA